MTGKPSPEDRRTCWCSQHVYLEIERQMQEGTLPPFDDAELELVAENEKKFPRRTWRQFFNSIIWINVIPGGRLWWWLTDADFREYVAMRGMTKHSSMEQAVRDVARKRDNSKR